MIPIPKGLEQPVQGTGGAGSPVPYTTTLPHDYITLLFVSGDNKLFYIFEASFRNPEFAPGLFSGAIFFGDDHGWRNFFD